MPHQEESGAGRRSGNAEGILPPPTISLPKGGGAIRGIGEKFAANPVTGTGSMTVPIAASPGRSGFGPQLALSYDSGTGNGPFGFGRSLSLPSITRKTEKGLPKYLDAEESDVFILSGAEDLVPVPAGAGGPPQPTVGGVNYNVRRYRPRVEGLFARIERWTNAQTGETHWRSISRDNVTTLYGKTPESRVADPADPARVFSWLICESYDDKGNAILYRYAAEDSAEVELSEAHEKNRTDESRSANRYLKRIKYGTRTPRQPGEDLTGRADWMFEVIFDYDEGHYEPLSADAQEPQFVQAVKDKTRDWSVRKDPFSTYRPTFEVRTYRLCRRVLIFHHFPDELGGADCLVRSTDFKYEETPIASFITAVTESGYVRQSGDIYLKKSLPPLEFEYSRAEVNEEVREIDGESLENLPYGLDGSNYQWIDLDGEGVSGVLTRQAGGWFYKRNLSPISFEPVAGGGERPAIRFQPVEQTARHPPQAGAGGGHQQFLDLAGDGKLDLVEFSAPAAGFYERTEDEGWESFRAFSSQPNAPWGDANMRFVDLTGDGHADALITEDDVFTWYPSLAEDGFAPAEKVRQDPDEERGPRLVFADGTESVYLADISGDGLTALVRVRSGEVCYWPNLGYGRFGAKVTMNNSPLFDATDQFDQKRVRLADIDGSGVTDIIYLGRDGVRLYFNQSGNGWSEARKLAHFPRADNLSAVQVADLSGNGTACLVWSSPLAGDARRPMRYVDLMGGRKPHLLVRVVNNLGAETRIHYASSTKFYLADELAGRPWITRLPFPVHVVERVETYDHVSRNYFVTRHAYHHGHFDGDEREFRGFGMVEQFDTEELVVPGETDEFPVRENIAAASHVPPVHTKTWFHTGLYVGRDHVSDFFAGLLDKNDAGEYYRPPGLGDEEAKELLLDDSVLPPGLTPDEEREACRALKGAMLRQEVYGLDDTDKEEHPYTVTEQNFAVELLQARGGNRHAVFFTHPVETLTHHYERNPEDPRVGHAITLEVDEYGNVLKSVSIGYGRDGSPLGQEDDRRKQTRTLITYTENGFTEPVDDPSEFPDAYRTPLPCEARTFELTGYKLEGAAKRFRSSAFVQPDPGDPDAEIDYQAQASTGLQRRVIEHVRTLYRRDNLSGLLPLGRLGLLAVPGESYKLAFTPLLVTEIYKRTLEPEPEENLLPDFAQVLGGTGADQGGYRSSQSLRSQNLFPNNQTAPLWTRSDEDNHWWIPSGLVFYSKTADVADPSATAAAELAEAQQHFFLPKKFTDPFLHSSTVDYDAHDLLVVKTQDAAQNSVTALQDYRVLQPGQVTDPNGNRSEAAFDALGMVVGTAVRGKVSGPDEGDSFQAFTRDLTPGQMRDYFDSPDPRPLAVAHLGTATTRIIYDLERIPACAAAIARETHVSQSAPGAETEVHLSFVYSDGFGREAQTKVQAEPGPSDPNWVSTGAKVYNNKGKPVRRFEPFFSPTHHFGIEKHGVSSTLFYDPPGRVVATLHPNHTWEKVVFDPWQQTTYDVNDTILNADDSTSPKSDEDVKGFFSRLPDDEFSLTWYEERLALPASDPERVAADKAAVHRQTPTVAHLDTLGRAFLTVARNRFERNGDIVEEEYPTRAELDIEGNQRAVRDADAQNDDPLGRVVMQYDYDMLGNRIHQSSMEAGRRWMLNDVTGKPIRAWDSRGFTRRMTYDELRRPTGLFVTEGGGERLAERTAYGEGQGAEHNHRTRVFQVFDGAGVVTSEAYDFKGNLLRSRRDLLPDYKAEVDWQQNPTTDGEPFTSSTEYDALNRPTAVTAPDGSVSRPNYNEANLLDRVEVNLRGAEAATPFVTNIDYNAKGQRTLIRYANGAETTYEYDDETFRLTHLKTTRAPGQNGTASQIFNDAATVQDLRYTYDPAGNITRIEDAALRTVVHNGEQVGPVCEYTYDAVYRLIKATGREHIGQTAHDFNPPDGNRRDFPFFGSHAHPNDLQAVRGYTERYEYDAVGNFRLMRHVADGGSWTRSYDYAEESLIESAKQSNRLTRTTVGNGDNFTETYTYADAQGRDVHGCMTAINNMEMLWDFEDQLRRVDLGGGGMAFYVYDAAGQRVRKVIETQNGTRKEERLYLGGFEVYRRFNGNGAAVTLRRETLHVMDDKQRIALVETKTHEASSPILNPASLIRYQLANHLGSVSLELDKDGGLISYEEYHPYGTTAYQTMTSAAEVSLKRYRYTGKERDEETGLYYHGARYYAPWLGRWTSCDPAGIGGGLNVYAYAGNQPVGFTDPSGRQPTCAPGRAGCIEEQMQKQQEEQGLDADAAQAAGKAFSEYDPTESEAAIEERIAKVSDPSYVPGATAASTAKEGKIDAIDVAKKVAIVAYLPLLIPSILFSQATENAGYLAREAGMSETDIAAANFALMMAGPGEAEALGYGIEALGKQIRAMSPAFEAVAADTRGGFTVPAPEADLNLQHVLRGGADQRGIGVLYIESAESLSSAELNATIAAVQDMDFQAGMSGGLTRQAAGPLRPTADSVTRLARKALELDKTQAAGHLPDVAGGGSALGPIAGLPKEINRSWGGQWGRYKVGFTFEGFSLVDRSTGQFLHPSFALENSPTPILRW